MLAFHLKIIRCLGLPMMAAKREGSKGETAYTSLLLRQGCEFLSANGRPQKITRLKLLLIN